MDVSMNVKYLVVTVVETIIKVIVIAAVIVFVFRGATKAYDFGYRVFADEPVSVSGGRTITVGIAEGASVREIAQMLEEKGLIEDANLFVVQELLSAYHGKILPGIYDLGTDMTAEQMLEIMSTPAEEKEQ
ncbi:MAG: endolytic transglycosylase MltG [Firmicutes bacterium]|nr:endolytic transglycosylase MltG [Bacillota bacterium]